MELLWQIEAKSHRIGRIQGDASDGGRFKAIVEAFYGWKVETIQKPPSKKGFVPQKGRWQIERSFGWLHFFRRLAKDYEKTTASAEAFIQIAFINVMLARIA
ncbi:MAG: hypothetical protein D6722_13175 [Bacteroidetes bacterium]|nr:MAG: hypothetical protein D6722_13175 [Bacteroidota bacterium]